MKLDRRSLIAGSAAACLAGCVPLERSVPGRLAAKFRILEASLGGTLGVSIRDTVSGTTLDYRADERFPHCSSFKLSLAAMVLKLDEEGTVNADERLRWTKADLMSVSPFTASRIDQGATLRELAEATQITSDNTAANLLLARLGGPDALTSFWRSLGDAESRLDRTEPELNIVPPGEIRDTTTPRAMAVTVQKLLYGDVLQKSGQVRLQQWMVDTATGARRVRAGLPQGWVSGDKTGTSIWPGMGSVYVDIGFAIPPGGTPLTFAAYFRARDAHQAMDPASEQVLRQVGSVIAQFAGQIAA